MHNPNPLPWPSSTTDHLVSLVQQLPPNTSNQYLRYILFCYSSLSSCTDHESDSSSDSMSSMSIYSASIGSIEIWCCLPLPFHTFYLFTGLLDPISDCPVECSRTTFISKGSGPALAIAKPCAASPWCFFSYSTFCTSHIFFQAASSACLCAISAFFCTFSACIDFCISMNTSLVASTPLPLENNCFWAVFFFFNPPAGRAPSANFNSQV